MNKFKVGDKVKVIKIIGVLHSDLGRMGIVRHIDTANIDYNYKVEFKPNDKGYFEAAELEKVKD